MRKVVRVLVGVVAVLLALVAGAYAWASVATTRVTSRVWSTHDVDFPVPYPIENEAGIEVPDDADSEQLALARARERGRHLVQSRYVCVECHGANFGGGVMVDAFPIGRFLAPNITTGEGGRTIGYTPTDWDRIVRHGLRRDGTPAVMPSEDFQDMSDQELSDIIAYVQSVPPVDNVVPPSTFGPLGKFLVATGELLSPESMLTSTEPHRRVPPPTEASVEFGRHIATVCTGCHRADFTGGPIRGGDPSWPPAANLTPNPGAFGDWTQEQFVAAVRTSVRADGSALRPPMTVVAPYAQRMSDVELEALWLFLRSLPALPTQ